MNEIILQSPLEFGNSWYNDSSFSVITGTNVEAYSGGTLYNCIEVTTVSPSMTEISLFSKGNGLVKNIFYHNIETALPSSLFEIE